MPPKALTARTERPGDWRVMEIFLVQAAAIAVIRPHPGRLMEGPYNTNRNTNRTPIANDSYYHSLRKAPPRTEIASHVSVETDHRAVVHPAVPRAVRCRVP